ncbi:ribosomal protein S18-alanine N-acetyltransferase [Microbacterium sp. MPKO10]|uniref:ribosomal protein S18-alanine N-acetyltransferase n=1 Tax=Microbacterium sp. MPKO10 TaxID=2989818 RepID=UPI002795C279|nr:ribosomal protein S18-alanine N-acetyltransferase [Microbacterium sp. MPKO10]
MIEIRDATRDDLDAIMELERSSFAPDDWSRDSMQREILSEHTRYLVAADDEYIVGYGGVLAPSGSADADIQTIAVAPEHRRTGIGRALMTRLVSVAASAGARGVFLEVSAESAGAQQLYLSLGFTQIGVRPRYYRGGIDAFVMKLDRPGEVGKTGTA